MHSVLSYTGAPIHTTSTTHQHVDLQGRISKWCYPLDAFSFEVLRNTKETLDHPPLHRLKQECSFVNLALNAVLKRHLLHSADTPRATTNGGGTRPSLGENKQARSTADRYSPLSHLAIREGQPHRKGGHCGVSWRALCPG